MKLLDRLLPTRRTRPVATPRGLWELRTARQDISRAFITPDFKTAFGLFTKHNRLHRLTPRQLQSLLANDHSQYLRPERID